VGLPADGHNVDLAVAVQIGRREVLDMNASLVEQVTLPLGALVIERLENPYTAFLAPLVAQIVADADNKLIAPVAVEIGAPDGMAPFQLVVENMALPQDSGAGGRSIHDDFITVPRLDCCDKVSAILELT